MARPYFVVNYDARLVVWTGDSFVFIGREDFRDLSSFAYFLTKDEKTPVYVKDKSFFIKAIPEVVNTSLSFDGSGRATVSFINKEGRFYGRSRADKERSDSLASDYLEHLYSQKIVPYKDLYRPFGRMFFKNLLSGELISEADYKKVSPVFNFFQPPMMCWIQVYDGYRWFFAFVGYIDSVIENEVTSATRRVTLNILPTAQMFTRIPAMTGVWSYVGLEKMLPEEVFVGKDITKSFLKVWFMSQWAAKDKDLAGTMGFDVVADIRPDSMFKKSVRALHTRFGLLNKQDLADLEHAIEDYGKDENLMAAYGRFGGLGTKPTKADFDAYKKIIQEDKFFTFKWFTEEPVLYEGECTKIRSDVSTSSGFVDTLTKKPQAGIRMDRDEDKVGFADLFQGTDDYGISCVGKIMIGPTFYGQERKQKMPDLAAKVLTPTIRWYQFPNVMVSNLFRKMSTALGVGIYNDSMGNLILDYNRLNDLPLISSKTYELGRESDSGDTNITRYMFHDDPYIIGLQDIRSSDFVTNSEQFKTALFMPIEAQGIKSLSSNEYLKRRLTGVAVASPAAFLRFGLNSATLESMYYRMNVNFTEIQGVRDKLASIFMNRLNSQVFTGTIDTRLFPYLQHGRNILVVHKERLYFINSISHQVSPGKSGSTNLAIMQGHSLGASVEDPWEYLFKEVIKKGVPTDNWNDQPSGKDPYSAIMSAASMTADKIQECMKNLLKDQDGYADVVSVMSNIDPNYFAGMFLTYGVEYGRGVTADMDLLHADPRLIYWLAKVWYAFKEEYKEEFGNGKDFKFIISSVLRPGGGNHKSRHPAGLASDICGIERDHSLDNACWRLTFKADAPSTSMSKIIPEALASMFRSFGFTDGEGDPTKNCIIWNKAVHEEEIRTKHTPDYDHKIHIHASVSYPQKEA